MAKQPAEREMPFAKVEVADEVERIFPPVMVSPPDEARPVALTPAKVEVALP
jgi:hypothetical protein